MLAFCGFNGFGQHGTPCSDKVMIAKGIQAFTVDSLPSTESGEEELLIAPSWSYTAYARGRNLILKGCLSDIDDSKLSVTAEDSIKQISVSDKFCLVLLENGEVFKILPQLDAVLEAIKFESPSSPSPSSPSPASPSPASPSNEPQKRFISGELKASEPLRIAHIATGANITAVISSTNALYSVLSQIYQFPSHLRVKQLLCGFEHVLLLSSNGDVYSWGNGFRGQLGEEDLRLQETPFLIEALAGIKMTFIAAGGWHSAAVSAFGDLYVWGFNQRGQLGFKVIKPTEGDEKAFKEPQVYPLPQVMDLPNCCSSAKITEDEVVESSCMAVKVFAGARHTIVQMSCGAIYGTGWNSHGQLALTGEEEDCDAFQRLEFLEKDVTEWKIICGPWNTIFQK